MKVPCGHCRMCKVARSREWALRITHEIPYHKDCVFATLTYRNEDLPPDLGLSKAVATNFLKRLRHYYKHKQIKYFLCGEYGDPVNVLPDDPHYEAYRVRGFARPHYHAILFGPSLWDHVLELVDPYSTDKGWKSLNGPINSSWGYGFIVLGTVNYHSARYCVQYMHKSFTEDWNNQFYLECQAPFQMQSSGLGKYYAYDNWEQLVRDCSVKHQGECIGLPRYYAKLLLGSATNTLRKRTKVAESLLAKRHHLDSKHHISSGWKQNDELEKQRILKCKTTLAGIDLNRKSKL